jgi:hypothetical protein
MKNSEIPAWSSERVERVHQRLADQGRDHRRRTERGQRDRQRPASGGRLLAALLEQALVPAQRPHRDAEIEEQQRQRDRNRQDGE